MIDLHNDFLTKLKDDKIIDYLENNKNYLDMLLCPVFTTELKNPLNFIKKSKKIIKKYNFCKIAIEDIGFLSNDDFDEILKIKPTYIGLTWNYANRFAGGAYSNSSLTNAGKYLIKKCEKSNILIDCAHLNYRSFCDVLNVIDRPIICSHTGFCDIVCDRRNLTKNQIKDIIESGGIIGLYFVGKYISLKNVEIYDIVKNIDYFVQNFGVDNLCIGSDFFGTDDLPQNLKSYNNIYILYKILVQNGYKNDDIDKIFNLNAKLFFDKYVY